MYFLFLITAILLAETLFDLCYVQNYLNTPVYISGKWPTWWTIILFYNTFITVLYMFRATWCSSSGGQIVLIQHLVSSLSVSGRPVCTLRRNSFSTCIPDGHLQRVTIPDAVLIKFDHLMMSTTLLETCRGL